MGTGGSFPGGKSGRHMNSEHLPPTTAEVRKMLIYMYTSTLPYAFMAFLSS
jgi:hypothetical protein